MTQTVPVCDSEIGIWRYLLVAIRLNHKPLAHLSLLFTHNTIRRARLEAAATTSARNIGISMFGSVKNCFQALVKRVETRIDKHSSLSQFVLI